MSGNPALLITGGYDDDDTVEMFSLSSLSSCTKPQPSLPSDAWFHSQTGNIVCGVGDAPYLNLAQFIFELFTFD